MFTHPCCCSASDGAEDVEALSVRVDTTATAAAALNGASINLTDGDGGNCTCDNCGFDGHGCGRARARASGSGRGDGDGSSIRPRGEGAAGSSDARAIVEAPWYSSAAGAHQLLDSPHHTAPASTTTNGDDDDDDADDVGDADNHRIVPRHPPLHDEQHATEDTAAMEHTPLLSSTEPWVQGRGRRSRSHGHDSGGGDNSGEIGEAQVRQRVCGLNLKSPGKRLLT